MKRRGRKDSSSPTKTGTATGPISPFHNPDFLSSAPGSSHGNPSDTERSQWNQFSRYTDNPPLPWGQLPLSGSGRVTVKTDIVVEVDGEKGPSSPEDAASKGERARVERHAGAFSWRRHDQDFV
jgi:hypothetical protein